MRADLWQRGCERLASELPDQQFNTWIRPLPDAEVADQGEAAVVTLRLDVDPLALNLTAKHPTARFPLEGGEYVLATVSPVAGGRSSIGLTWGRMPDDMRLAEVKDRMREWLRSVG